MSRLSRAVVMTFGDPSIDPRPNRMIHLMNDLGFRVDVLCPEISGSLPIESHIHVSKMHKALVRYPKILRNFFSKKSLKYEQYYADLGQYCTFNFGDKNIEDRYQVVIVADLQLLPAAFMLGAKAKVIFDAREYYPLQNEESLLWRILERPDRLRLCRSYFEKIDIFLTVSPGLCQAYKKYFGVEPIILRSTPAMYEINPKKTDFSCIKLVHHGVANRNRRLHKMIELMDLLDDRFDFDMYLTGDPNYIDFLKRLASQKQNVSIKKPIKYNEIVNKLSNYDIGIFYNEPTTFNLRHSLPNKIFEFIQARLAVAIAPSPDMKDLVEEYDCGVVAADFHISEMARSLNLLTENKLDRLKKNSHIAASKLNIEKEQKNFLKILKEKLGEL